MSNTIAPMFVLFTDFGGDGPYVGQMKAVLAQQAPGIPIIDLLHLAPRFNSQASAHFLAAYVSVFPEGSVVLGVVDPGVGSAQRKPIVCQIAGRWYIGPDNGLFDVLAARAVQAGENVSCWEISWRPQNLSNSFHGRDLFAPVAARLAQGEAPPGEPMDWPLPVTAAEDFPEIIFIDHFGNAITGLRAGNVDTGARLEMNGHSLVYARTFSEVAAGQGFWYENANGLVELAVNQGSAADELGLSIGTSVTIRG
jgi:S-adenosylmethionine hydrolase